MKNKLVRIIDVGTSIAFILVSVSGIVVVLLNYPDHPNGVFRGVFLVGLGIVCLVLTRAFTHEPTQEEIKRRDFDLNDPDF